MTLSGWLLRAILAWLVLAGIVSAEAPSVQYIEVNIMSGSIPIALGTGGGLLSADDVEGTRVQQVKLVSGAPGVGNPTDQDSGYPIDFALGSLMRGAFSRLRTAGPEVLSTYAYDYDTSSVFWSERITGTASTAHDSDLNSVQLTVGTSVGDEIVRQTLRYHPHQHGKSQLSIVSLIAGDLPLNVRFRAGYFDDRNGLFAQQFNGVTSLVMRSDVTGSVVDTPVEQNAVDGWNGDKLNTTGASGLNLEIENPQTVAFEIQGSGMGAIPVCFIIDGNPIIAHTFNALNTDEVFFTFSNLPIRYELTNVDGGTGATTSGLPSCVISEGGFEDIETPFGVSSGTTPLSVTSRVPILSIRPKATFNSIVNRGEIIAQIIDVLAVDNAICVELIYDGALTGASWVSVDPDSITEFDTSATAITGGIVKKPLFVGAGLNRTDSEIAAIANTFPMTLDIDGANPKALSVVVDRLITSPLLTAEVWASLSWGEKR